MVTFHTVCRPRDTCKGARVGVNKFNNIKGTSAIISKILAGDLTFWKNKGITIIKKYCRRKRGRMMDDNNAISQERLELIYDSALRQFRGGRSFEKVIVTLYTKGLEEDEAKQVADRAYQQYIAEEQQKQRKERYDKPLLSIPQWFKSFAIKMISFVLSMFLGHFINIERWIKRDEKRVQ